MLGAASPLVLAPYYVYFVYLAAWQQSLAGSWLGLMIRGLVKIGLAAVVAAMLANINIDLSAVTLGNVTIDLSIIWDVTKVFAPLLLIISGLRDLGVRL